MTSGYSWRSDTICQCLQARVAAFGSHDLGFRTSINGHRVSLSRPGFQDLKSSPSYGRLILFPSLFSASTVTFLCVQWSQTHAQTDKWLYIYDLRLERLPTNGKSLFEACNHHFKFNLKKHCNITHYAPLDL